jgi:hypothetical protein
MPSKNNFIRNIFILIFVIFHINPSKIRRKFQQIDQHRGDLNDINYIVNELVDSRIAIVENNCKLSVVVMLELRTHEVSAWMYFSRL